MPNFGPTSSNSPLATGNKTPPPIRQQDDEIKGPARLRYEATRNSFYRALVLWKALSNRDHEVILDKPHTTPGATTDFRNFLETLAKISELKKEKYSTTAIAAEQAREKIILHVAQNECSEEEGEEICIFLVGILKELRTVTKENAEQVEKHIFEKCLEFWKEKLSRYWTVLSSHLLKSYPEAKAISNGTLEELHSLTRDKSNQTLEAVCRLCIKSSKLKTPEKESYQPYSLKFSPLIRDLGYSYKVAKRAAKTLVALTQRLKMDSKEIEVFHRPSSKKPTGRLYNPNINLAVVLDQMRTDCGVTGIIPDTLKKVDNQNGLSQTLRARGARGTRRQYIHAELVILEWAYAKNLNFVDSDKFIACSKPACYCCQLYIRHHPGKFVQPMDHPNVYLNWELPEMLENGNEQLSDGIETTLEDMTRYLQKKVLDQIFHLCGQVQVEEDHGIKDIDNDEERGTRRRRHQQWPRPLRLQQGEEPSQDQGNPPTNYQLAISDKTTTTSPRPAPVTRSTPWSEKAQAEPTRSPPVEKSLPGSHPAHKKRSPPRVPANSQPRRPWNFGDS